MKKKATRKNKRGALQTFSVWDVDGDMRLAEVRAYTPKAAKHAAWKVNPDRRVLVNRQ